MRLDRTVTLTQQKLSWGHYDCIITVCHLQIFMQGIVFHIVNSIVIVP